MRRRTVGGHLPSGQQFAGVLSAECLCHLTIVLMQRAAWIRGGKKACPRCGRNKQIHRIAFIDRGVHGISCTGCGE